MAGHARGRSSGVVMQQHMQAAPIGSSNNQQLQSKLSGLAASQN